MYRIVQYYTPLSNKYVHTIIYAIRVRTMNFSLQVIIYCMLYMYLIAVQVKEGQTEAESGQGSFEGFYD